MPETAPNVKQFPEVNNPIWGSSIFSCFMFGIISRDSHPEHSHPQQKDVARLVASTKGIYKIYIKRVPSLVPFYTREIKLRYPETKVIVRLRRSVTSSSDRTLEENVQESPDSEKDLLTYLIFLPEEGTILLNYYTVDTIDIV